MKIENELEIEYVNFLLSKFSEHKKDFLRDTKHDEILIVILKTHLFIEQEMKELTNIYFKNPAKLKNFMFKNRLDILFGLGVLPKELYDPIKVLNNIRNDLGHELSFVFSEESYKKLYDSLSNELLIEFKKDLQVVEFFNKDITHIEKMKILLACIWTSLKAIILTSFKYKQELAKEYEIQVYDELLEFKKNNK